MTATSCIPAAAPADHAPSPPPVWPIVETSALVIAKGKLAAAHVMEAAEGDIEFANGRFTIAGTDRGIDIMELSRRLREGKLPEGVPSSLSVDQSSKEV